MADKVRIGAVSYLNTRPLVFGMEQGLGADRVELSYDVPAVLADRLQAGQIDIALLPVIELARQPDLELVPGLSISTMGPSRSVLLVCRKPIEELRTLALDPSSRTSNVLAQLLCAEVWGRRPECRPGSRDISETLADCDGAVRSGDKALFEPLPDGCLSYDLGGVWTARTGLPFVFAAWTARRGVVDDEIYRVLHDSRRAGSRVIDLIAEDYTWQGRQFPQLAAEYLTRHIRFRLGNAEIDAMNAFFAAAKRLELIDQAPQIRLALERNATCQAQGNR